MKLQIIPALTFLFFMMLFSFVKLQITPTQNGFHISFGQEAQPAAFYSATTPIKADEKCYSMTGELDEQFNKSMKASIDQIPELQHEQIEKIIDRLTTSTDRLQRLDEVEIYEILP